MIYDVTHLTRYEYGAPVVVNDCVLRLRPREEPGQRVSGYKVEVRPTPSDFVEHADAFANRVARLRIETPHRQDVDQVELPRRGRARGAADRGADAAVGGDGRARRRARNRSTPTVPPSALYPSRRVSLFAAATGYARESFAPKRPDL